MSTYHYSQITQDTDSYKRLLWQQYFTILSTFLEAVEMPTHTHQMYHHVMENFKMQGHFIALCYLLFMGGFPW